MTLAEQLFEQGEKAGREQGEKAGQRKSLRRLLELKFGPLDTTISARVDAATEADLERYTERVLTATSVDEVLDG